MDTKKLRQKVLDLAIHGKLVKQDPNDEPASILLDRIRAEKARLVKEGKIKKSDLIEKPISEEEIPFEVPEGWEWVKLSEIALLIGGYAFKSNQYTDTGSRVIRISDITPNGFSDKNIVRHQYSESLSQFIIQKNDILMAMTGGTVGKCTLVKELPEELLLLNQRVANIRPLLSNASYICYQLSSDYIKSIISNSKNSTNDNISMVDIGGFLVPLPPLAEQHRIVKAVDELFEQIDIIERSEKELEEAANKTRDKLLNLAIQGHLVPQDPNEEPASVLLERIRAEKARLVKEGKLKKKDLEEKPISPDEIPFDIPEGWEWVRGGTAFLPMESTKPSGDTFVYIDVDAVNNKRNIIDNAKTLSSAKAPSRATRKLHCHDILFSMVRPYLKNIAYVNEEYENAIASTGFYVITPTCGYYPEFLFHLMLTPYVINGLNQFMKGDNSPSINNSHIEQFLFPIPPLAEQRRIVEKIEEILSAVEKLHS